MTLDEIEGALRRISAALNGRIPGVDNRRTLGITWVDDDGVDQDVADYLGNLADEVSMQALHIEIVHPDGVK